MILDPNDPKLTAYALGELDDKERAAIEAELAKSPDARRAVEGIRRTAALLEQELQQEPSIALSQTQREAIESQAAKSNGQVSPVTTRTPPFWRRHWIPTSLAASLLIVVGIGYSLLPSLSRSRELPRSRIVPMRTRQPAGIHPPPGSPNAQQRTVRRTSGLKKGIKVRRTAKRRRRPAGTTPGSLSSLGYVGAYSANAALTSSGGWVSGMSFRDGDFAVPGAVHGGAFNTEAYDGIVDNPFLEVTQHPLSTFSIDVDTASYSNIRRFLNGGRLPPKDAVRIEEMINYFSYDYPLPAGDDPFSVDVTIAECPWEPDHLLARIGLKGMEIADEERPAANLVFLLDVSGSMRPPNKLPLVIRAMRLLVEGLLPDDRVAIVVYAGASGLVLESTSCNEKATILSALDRLQAGSSTNGGQGIQLAYDVAGDYFSPDGINRVILATDGDFNVGVTNQGDLTRLIEEKAETGVFLTVLGFGMGNYQDSTLEKLADKGNGNYAYIDTFNEARKVFVEQLNGTLITIAKDVKIQVEFNPAQVAAYRLIGYENRMLQAQDFNDDTKDAGEIGAGHTVTALYELVPAGESIDHVPTVDPLKYQAPPEVLTEAAGSGETMTVKLRYKEPNGDTSKLLEFPITDSGMALADAPDDFIFAASVASFGMLLRDSPHKGNFTYDAVLELAQQSLGEDEYGYRAEFTDLVKQAQRPSTGQ